MRAPRYNLVGRELGGFLFQELGPVDTERNEVTYRYRHSCGHEGIIRASQVITRMPTYCEACRPKGAAERSGVRW